MRDQVRSRSLPVVLAVALLLSCHPAWAGSLSMKDHMEIESQPRNDPELGTLPSVQIDSIQASVPVDDRMNADAAFNHPFTESLREGMAWYLRQRGLRIVDDGGDLRLTGTIDSYEGWKGWGHWGVDVHLRTKLFRASQTILSEDLRSFLKYSDDEDVEDEEKPKYNVRDMEITFTEILFTRVGIDLSEKLIVLMKEKAELISGAGDNQPPAEPASKGKLSLEATAPHAEVFVDGKLVGTTPVIDLLLSATTHFIEIRKSGFKPWKREVAVLEGATSRIIAELEVEKPE